MKQPITIETTVNSDINNVWKHFNEPESIKGWAFANEDWHAPASENDLRVGGSFKTTMAAKDGSFSFDFGGVYNEVRTNERIAYTLGDGRKVTIDFAPVGDAVKVTETFDPEAENSEELQRAGWQAILDNFRKYAESH